MWSALFSSQSKADAVPQKKDVVRVKVKKYDGYRQPETKRFSLDPDLTDFRTLHDIIAKAFHLDAPFVILYLIEASNGTRRSRFLPLLSDWDVNAAIHAASNPQLLLKIDMKPFENGLEEWDIIEADDLYMLERNDDSNGGGGSVASASPHHQRKSASTPAISLRQHATALPQLVTSNLPWFKTTSSGPSSSEGPPASPGAVWGGGGATKARFGEADLRRLLDYEGRLSSQRQLRLAVFQAGVEPSLRPVVWRHLLNVYPDDNMTGEARIEYTRRLAGQYTRMKLRWQEQLRSGRSTDELRLIANAVRKDVVRTDRHHAFFSGDDDTNANVLLLFNLLTTYALAHPSVSYCQGMSDLASPLLIVLGGDEAQAYVCFCALMRRLQRNFQCDGRSMTVKFRHLNELLQHYDPAFYEYLRETHAEDLLFCYRWLLLELKREFKFEDSLLVMEVMWASMPPDPPDGELAIFEIDLTECGDVPFSPPPAFYGAPSSDRTLRMLGTALLNNGGGGAGEEKLPLGDDEDGDGSSEEEEEQEDDSGKMSAASSSVASLRLACDRVEESAAQRRRQQSGAGEFTLEVIESVRSDRSDSTLKAASSSCALNCAAAVAPSTSLGPVQSCPGGSLNGLCHVAVVRSLMLGGKSSEAKLHSSSSAASTGHFCRASSANHHQAQVHRRQPRRIRRFGGTPDPETVHASLSPPSSPHECDHSSSVVGSRRLRNFSLQDDAVLCNAVSAERLGDGRNTDAPAGQTLPPSSAAAVFAATAVNERDRQSSLKPDQQQENNSPTAPPTAVRCGRRRVERRIIAQRELHVTDDDEDGQPQSSATSQTGSSSTAGGGGSTCAKDSPVPLACEAAEDGSAGDAGATADGELTLVDIYDMCVGQVAETVVDGAAAAAAWSPSSSSLRSRQTSGDPSMAPSAGSGGGKTRHVSQKTNHSSTVPDSGYSGATTPCRPLGGATDRTAAAPAETAAGQPARTGSVTSLTSAASTAAVDQRTDGGGGVALLPTPAELGDGNPFMLFVCLALLLLHRERIVGRRMDFNEIAIYFDKLARKHSAHAVLKRARRFYADYIKSDCWWQPLATRQEEHVQRTPTEQ